ncbi:MAG: alginate lyase family protein [Mangrovibacterium sp.]
MTENRRKFIRKLTGGGAGICWLGSFGSPFGLRQPGNPGENSGGSRPVFPFFSYVEKYTIGEFIPKDQGGKFVQMEIAGTEDDREIVQKIRAGLLERTYGDPIDWGALEKTELEKSVWLNRFYYLPAFARIYYLEKDEEALRYMVQFIRKWVHENPRVSETRKSRYNWFDMQVAWRAIHLSWCYFLAERGLTDEDKKLITGTLEEHAAALAEGFGKQTLNEFNHQAHGALAMLYMGVLFPSFPASAGLVPAALRILDHHIRHAFYPDGGNVEQMFGYYPFEASLFRDACLLCRANRIDIPGSLVELLHKMIRFISLVEQPDQTMPPVNDSYEMATGPVLSTLCTATGHRQPCHQPASAYFPETQIAVMRAAGDRNSWYALVNPAKTIGAHAHAGRLAFTLWCNQKPLFIDSGCCSYDRPELVSWYRTSRAHNTVLIDGTTDEATSSVRLWAPKRTTENRITDWIETADYTFCRMVSPSAEPVNAGVDWSRSLVLVKDQFFVIHDCYRCEAEHQFEMLLHFAPGQIKATDQTIRVGDGGPVIMPACAELAGMPVISKGLVSVKGRSVSTPVAAYQFRGRGMVHAVFIVFPQGQPFGLPNVEQQDRQSGTGITIRGEDGKISLLFKNPASEALTLWGHRTTRIFELF